MTLKPWRRECCFSDLVGLEGDGSLWDGGTSLRVNRIVSFVQFELTACFSPVFSGTVFIFAPGLAFCSMGRHRIIIQYGRGERNGFLIIRFLERENQGLPN